MLSKYALSVPLKNKVGIMVTNALQRTSTSNKFNRKPNNMGK